MITWKTKHEIKSYASYCILIKPQADVVSRGPIPNKQTLVWILAWNWIATSLYLNQWWRVHCLANDSLKHTDDPKFTYKYDFIKLLYHAKIMNVILKINVSLVKFVTRWLDCSWHRFTIVTYNYHFANILLTSTSHGPFHVCFCGRIFILFLIISSHLSSSLKYQTTIAVKIVKHSLVFIRTYY